jgi:hypothetical protein
MVIEDIKLEQLIEKIAKADGVSVTEVLQESLNSLITLRGVIDRKARLQECLAELKRGIDTT